MISTPEIVEVPARKAAAVHVTVDRSHIRLVMGPAIREIYQCLAAQNVTPAGPWLTLHHRITDTEFDFDACVPVSASVLSVGRVRQIELPAARCASAVHSGAYEGLAGAWGELHQWMREHGHSAATWLYETYLTGPESSEDSAQWRTELRRPLL
jgi:effector-binding domain-containing protein